MRVGVAVLPDATASPVDVVAVRYGRAGAPRDWARPTVLRGAVRPAGSVGDHPGERAPFRVEAFPVAGVARRVRHQVVGHPAAGARPGHPAAATPVRAEAEPDCPRRANPAAGASAGAGSGANRLAVVHPVVVMGVARDAARAAVACHPVVGTEAEVRSPVRSTARPAARSGADRSVAVRFRRGRSERARSGAVAAWLPAVEEARAPNARARPHARAGCPTVRPTRALSVDGPLRRFRVDGFTAEPQPCSSPRVFTRRYICRPDRKTRAAPAVAVSTTVTTPNSVDVSSMRAA